MCQIDYPKDWMAKKFREKIMKTLTRGQTEVYSFSFTQEQMDAFTVLSGDSNVIHESDQAAAELGSPIGKDTAPGGLIVMTVSKVLGTIFPGNGTIWCALDIKFKHPILIGQPYSALFG